MTREVNINGKIAIIESGRELPPHCLGGKGRGKSDFRLLMEAMKPGESVALPLTPADIQSKSIYTLGKAIGKSLYYRSEGNGVRIFCTGTRAPAQTAKARSNGAARPARDVRPVDIRSAWAS